MLPIPAALQASFEAYLRAGKIPETAHAYYKKWLRFYLDFCRKYRAAPSRRESLPLFLQKLQEKKQAEWQQQQATHAVSLYYELLQAEGHHNLSPPRPNPLPRRVEENRAGTPVDPAKRSAYPAGTSSNPADTSGKAGSQPETPQQSILLRLSPPPTKRDL
jgi:hypothetical protein